MTTPIEVWLRAADELFGRTADAPARWDGHPDDDVDDLIRRGLDIDVPDTPVAVDPVQLERVLAVLRARSAAMATEIADLARRRVELTRAQLGATGYLNAPPAVPME